MTAAPIIEKKPVVRQILDMAKKAASRVIFDAGMRENTGSYEVTLKQLHELSPEACQAILLNLTSQNCRFTQPNYRMEDRRLGGLVCREIIKHFHEWETIHRNLITKREKESCSTSSSD